MIIQTWGDLSDLKKQENKQMKHSRFAQKTHNRDNS